MREMTGLLCLAILDTQPSGTEQPGKKTTHLS